MSHPAPSEVVLSVLIVNFNGKSFLPDCLDSIKKNISIPHEIIVVDNGSHDGSVDFVRQNYPDVKIIASLINTGFTGGNNLAAKYATGRYLLLLNNDTVVRSPLAPLIEKMDANHSIGVMGCRLLYGDGRQQESVGYMPSVLSLALSWTPLGHIFLQSALFCRTVYAKSALYGQTYSEVEWVSGAFLLTRADLWRRLGGLDEHYFMYMEDTDYCRRIRELGYLVVYSACTVVTHFEGAGRAWIGERAVLNTTHSYLVYTNKYYGGRGSLLLRLLLSPIFFTRAVAHGLLGVAGSDTNGFSKAKAYGRAALKLLGVTS